jgi:lipopolysaccharide exporter
MRSPTPGLRGWNVYAGAIVAGAVFRARTAQNVAIVVGLNWFGQILSIATKVVLARLLFPSDFGIFALAGGLVSFIGTFGNFGLNYAIIQKGDSATKEDYDVGMTLRLLISVGLLVASIAAAGPWAALFPLFPAPVVTSTTQVLAFVYLITPWGFVPSTRLTAELRYKAQVIPSLAGQLGNATASILLAFLGFGVWSLILGLILGQVAANLAYSIALPWRWRPSLRWRVAKPLMGYARHLVAAAVLTFLITNIDNFTVGVVWGSAALGLYAVAYGLGYIPVSLISTPAGSALFPSFAKIQDDIESLRGGYLESLGYAIAIIAPASIGLAVTAPEIVEIVLGPKWLGATLALVVLAFYGLARALVDFSSSLFSAVGQPRIVAELNLYILVLSIIPLYPLTLWWNIAGTAVAMTVPVVIVVGVSIFRTARVLQTRRRDVLRRGVGPLLAAMVMGGFVLVVRVLLYGVLPARIFLPIAGLSMAVQTAVFLIAIPAGVAAYFALLRVFDREMFEGLWRHLWIVVRPNREELRSDEPLRP